MGPPASPTPPVGRPLARLGRRLRSGFVFLIVVFHLFVLFVRNPLDFWAKEVRAWMKERGHWEAYGGKSRALDKFTYKYPNLVGCEQRFVMFRPPMARRAPFLAVRFELTDGTTEVVRSYNEPDPTRFFRFGDWQLRK